MNTRWLCVSSIRMSVAPSIPVPGRCKRARSIGNAASIAVEAIHAAEYSSCREPVHRTPPSNERFAPPAGATSPNKYHASRALNRRISQGRGAVMSISIPVVP